MKQLMWVAAGVWAGLGASAAAQQYAFTINPVPSGISGSASVGVEAAGTLVGSYDGTANPKGTRTKPGILGTFGPTENVPVPMGLGASIGGDMDSDTAGGFGMTLNPGLGLVWMEGFAADFLSSGPVSLPAALSLEFDSFRTRSPTSLFLGGIPLNVPFGEAAMTRLRAEQIVALPGTLTPAGAGVYDFTIIPIVRMTAEFSVLGSSFEVPWIPAPMPLKGTIALNGSTAHLLSVCLLEHGGSVNPNLALPQLPLDLPTILPPGETANLLMDLTLSELGAGIDATLTLDATGVLVPAPWSAMVLGVSGVLVMGRRRR